MDTVDAQSLKASKKTGKSNREVVEKFELMSRPIYLIYCYPRSGGTLMNKYLAKDDNLVVLSEVHPVHNRKGGLHSVKAQMRKWYNVELVSQDYVAQILEAKLWCDQNNKLLVVRDWTYIDFAKSHLNDYAPPLASTNLELLREHASVRQLAFVRDGIDVFLSIGGDIEDFSTAYGEYVQFIKKNNIEIHKYEEFVSNSDRALKRIYATLEQPQLQAHGINLLETSNITGDTSLSRGNTNVSVVKIKRRYAAYWKRKRIDRNIRLCEANKYLGYSMCYSSREIEPFLDWIWFEFRTFPKNLRSWKHNVARSTKFRIKKIIG